MQSRSLGKIFINRHSFSVRQVCDSFEYFELLVSTCCTLLAYICGGKRLDVLLLCYVFCSNSNFDAHPRVSSLSARFCGSAVEIIILDPRSSLLKSRATRLLLQF